MWLDERTKKKRRVAGKGLAVTRTSSESEGGDKPDFEMKRFEILSVTGDPSPACCETECFQPMNRTIHEMRIIINSKTHVKKNNIALAFLIEGCY